MAEDETVTPPIPDPPEASSHPAPKPDKEASERDYMARVNRAAAEIVRKRLKCTLEEAEKMISKGRKAEEQETAAETARVTADGVIRDYEAKLAKLQAERDEKDRLLEEERKARAKDKRRAEDHLLEVQVQHAARATGFRDPEYAVTLYARGLTAFLAVPENKGKTLDPGTYFEGLKGQESYAHLFHGTKPAEAPKPPPVAPSTAPAESPAPGGGAPPPPPAGDALKGKDGEKSAMDMDEQEFKAHMRAKYNWSPGAF